jgi:MFS superfamily sulfate permease-like transporter
VQGLLAAIGVILVLKQIPHVLGHDADPEGEMAFLQPDHRNTFTEILAIFGDYQLGAALIGLLSIGILVLWEKSKTLKRSSIPAPLAVVLFGVLASQLLRLTEGSLAITASHFVRVPIAASFGDFIAFLRLPNFTQWMNPAVYTAAISIALIASLETLLNLEAVDKIDPKQRTSPPSRELIAQGIGNMCVGLIGGIPISSVIVRSSVNINAGCETKASTVVHGCLMLICVMFLPSCLNLIPLSCLAAILFCTGLKLVSPSLIRQMWNDGRYQFIPFIATVIAIVLTDLLVGILLGLAISISFILQSHFRRPFRRIMEKQLGGDVMRIELANQVSFFNRAVLDRNLNEIPEGGHVLLDARNTAYIDPDVLSLIRDFKERTAPTRGVQVSLLGFRERYHLEDEIQYVEYSDRNVQSRMTPVEVLQILKDGNERFRKGRHLTRDFGRQMHATSVGQFPLAVVLGCIDSRTPSELIFDLGLGDIFTVRVAGNVVSDDVLGSIEYSCAVAGAKLLLVLGHTQCGAVGAAVDFALAPETIRITTGCQHLGQIIHAIQKSINPGECVGIADLENGARQKFVNEIARHNVLNSMKLILETSETLNSLARESRIRIVGAIYDVSTGEIEFLT